MPMPQYVHIYVYDADRKLLEHHYVRADAWAVPGGRIEQGEVPVEAARRELLERTGYDVDVYDLIDDGIEGETEVAFRFKTTKEKLRRIAEPGERGGYSTEIRWR